MTNDRYLYKIIPNSFHRHNYNYSITIIGAEEIF